MGQRDIVRYETSMKRKNRIRAASMCRLDVESAAKEVEQPRDALSSSRYLLGRGVKRKLSECDGVADAGGVGGSPGPLPYPQQRQLVLDLCLDKLQSCQRRPEPSLHRSVLLANTLRHLQQEMRQEDASANASATLPASLQPPPAPSLPLLPLPPVHALTPRHAPELPPVPSDLQLHPSSGPGVDEVEEGKRSGLSHPLSSWSSSSVTLSSVHDSLFGTFEITSSTSCYLSDMPLDDIFEDIDTSMYDASDLSALALTPAQRAAGAAAAGGGGDEVLLKGFSSSSSSSSSGCTPSSALQFCLADLSDLDHIMEILVQS
ncbi:SERTA domain-containing protein 2 [Engraulis encrasicolus]|uniref:SERTA domain-containing protein 2 n=1 Tax=Engraulis encrasicolus TaxID=184585 RepID=UPI002FD6637E